MGKVFHYHGEVGPHGDKGCSLTNGHDSSCSKGQLTNNNEDSCEKVDRHPEGKPYKCTHNVPDDKLRSVIEAHSEIDLWRIKSRPKKRGKAKRSARRG